MGSTADAGRSEAGGAEAADASGAGCVFEFGEGQNPRRDRVRRKARRGGRGDESGGDAASGRGLEVAIRCEEPAAVPFSGTSKVAGGSIDARGSFATSGSVSGGQRSCGTRQRRGTGARHHHRATKRDV